MAVPYEALYQKMALVLQSKCEEFQLYNYQEVTPQQIWQFCVERKWRKRPIEQLHLYEMVATIFSITPADLMQYIQAKDVMQRPALTEINSEELDLLLGRNNKLL